MSAIKVKSSKKIVKAPVFVGKSYKADDVLEAYEKGKEEGMQLKNAIYLKIFKDNIANTFEASKRIANFLSEEKISCHKIFIKPDEITEFKLFFIVSNKKYHSVEFAKMYTLAYEKIKDIQSDVFELDFSFLPNSKSLDEEKLKDDNFLMIYNEAKSGSRKA